MDDDERDAKLAALAGKIEARKAERKARYKALVAALKNVSDGDAEALLPLGSPEAVPPAAAPAGLLPPRVAPQPARAPGASRGWAVVREEVENNASKKGVRLFQNNSFSRVVDAARLQARLDRALAAVAAADRPLVVPGGACLESPSAFCCQLS